MFIKALGEERVIPESAGKSLQNARSLNWSEEKEKGREKRVVRKLPPNSAKEGKSDQIGGLPLSLLQGKLTMER